MKIQDVLRHEYLTTELQASVECLSWAVDKVARLDGPAEAAKQLRKVNRLRRKDGRIGYLPPYGHQVFEVYLPSNLPDECLPAAGRNLPRAGRSQEVKL